MVNDYYGNLQYSKKRYLYPIRNAILNNTKTKLHNDSDIKSCLYKIHTDFNTIQWRGLHDVLSQYITVGQVIDCIQKYFNILLQIQLDNSIKQHIK